MMSVVLSAISVTICSYVTWYVSSSPKLYAIGCILTALSILTLLVNAMPTEKYLGEGRVKLVEKEILRVIPYTPGNPMYYLRSKVFYYRVLYITKHNNPKFYKKHKREIHRALKALSKLKYKEGVLHE